VVEKLEWEPGEKPKYAFCESAHASSISPWHIREVGKAGLKLGGGIDTSTFCGRVRPLEDRGGGGWDLNVRITAHHLTHCCPLCAAEYRKATGA
jgi:hypothetical protein